MFSSVFSISRRSAIVKGFMAILLLPAIAAPAKAFPLGILVPAAGYLVGRGLIDEARGAVQASIADADQRLKERIEQAHKKGEQLVVQWGEESRKSLKEAERIMLEAIEEARKAADDQRQKVFQDLMKQQEFFFKQLDERQARVFLGLHAILRQGDELLGRHVQTILTRAEIIAEGLEQAARDANPANKVPLLGKPYRLRRLVWDGVVYKPSGEYEFNAIGYGLGTEAKETKVYVNREAVQPKGRKANCCDFVVPVEKINHLFKDTEPVPIPVRLESDYLKVNSTIWLFPKFPVKSYRLTVEVGGRDQQLFVESPGRGFYDAEEAIVRKLKGDNKAVRQRAGEIHNLMRTRLPFGNDFKVELPDSADSTTTYELYIEWANGDRITLRNGKTFGKGVTTDRNGKWLYIDIGPNRP